MHPHTESWPLSSFQWGNKVELKETPRISSGSGVHNLSLSITQGVPLLRTNNQTHWAIILFNDSFPHFFLFFQSTPPHFVLTLWIPRLYFLLWSRWKSDLTASIWGCWNVKGKPEKRETTLWQQSQHKRSGDSSARHQTVRSRWERKEEKDKKRKKRQVSNWQKEWSILRRIY